MCRSATYDFLLMFLSIHGPISYHFRDKRQFQSRITKFSHPSVFCAHAEGASLGIGYRWSGSKNKNDVAIGPRKKFDDTFSHLGTITNVTDRLTDRQTLANSKDHAYA